MLAGSLGRIGYVRARRLLLAAGIVILLVLAGVMYARRVEAVEVAGTLLFIPVFVAFIFWGVQGGIAAGILATAAYAAFRYPAIEAVGADRFVPLMVSRGVAYLAFGAIGGWANRQLETSLTKLEIYDQIDDQTGLFNAGFFVQDTDLEMSRSKRYRTIFSVAVVDVGGEIENLSRRGRKSIPREIARLLQQGVRTVDRPIHAFDGNKSRFAVILPETGSAGARVFGERLERHVADLLQRRGIAVTDDGLALTIVTFPDEETALEHLRSEFAAIDRLEHPEGSEARANVPANERRATA